jgi:hypothetical protein
MITGKAYFPGKFRVCGIWKFAARDGQLPLA